uniref:protein-tyrosine-phosphatase n=1 Tax=Globisporangium ultimum (strain ATCC 200006 / CBS 805.95 / DAOM BR144) TaxID=431595 RepID=K3WJ76_GLOUD
MTAAEKTSEPPPLYDRVVVVPEKLEYAVTSQTTTTAPRPTAAKAGPQAKELYVCIDDELVYARFFADFGPLNLAQTVRFCNDVHQKLAAAAVNGSDSGCGTALVVVYSSDHPHKRANAMALLVLYLVIVHKCTPEQAVARFQSVRPPFGFRDAAYGICTFFITMLDCASAVHKAIQSGIWSLESFSLSEYEHYDQLQHGDVNWIIPGKLMAFSGPQRERIVLDGPGKSTSTLLAQDYATLFRQLSVSCVVRFNEPSTYDRKAFLHAGIQHLDLQYPDGGNPPDEILHKFLRTCERETGAVAVHCKAGLGRTGTNIAAYLMKNYRFTAREAIAWCRICRPGSIVGPQQHYLAVKQRELFQLSPFETITMEKETTGLRRKTKKKQNTNIELRR